MRSWTIPITITLAVAASGTARADQCQLVDSGTAVRALQILHDHPQVAAYCEPCGDRAPGEPTVASRVATERDRSGAYQVVIDRREIDLAYTFVQTGPSRFDNLARLAGCPASGVSASIALVVPQPPAPVVVAAPPPPPPVAHDVTTYVVEARSPVSFWALLGTCTATSAACTLGLLLVVRRRRIAMRPRALELVDRREHRESRDA